MNTRPDLCPRCIEDWTDENQEEHKGTEEKSDCADCGVCHDCEHLSGCEWADN